MSAETPHRETFVIVGAGLAGAKAAETLRAEGFAGRIVLIGDEEERPYERPPLSKGYLLGSEPRDSVFVHDATWYAEHDVELRRGVRATMLDAAGHQLTLDGYQQLRYDKLLLATGSRVQTLPAPGATLPQVRYLRTVDDAEALLARYRAVGKAGKAGKAGAAGAAVIVGAGWIGLECAAAAVEHGLAVTVVEPEPVPLRRVVGDELGEYFTSLHTGKAVSFRFGQQVAEIDAEAVTLTDGTRLPATVVVVGIGITPAVELAEAAGLAVDDGVVTDERLRTSAPDVYACGDVASSLRPWLGSRVRVEHWSNALDGGAAAARSMLGSAEPYDQVPFFFSDQYDMGLEFAGYLGGGYDRVVYRGEVAGGEFIAFWLRGDKVLAGMNVNVWDVTEHIQALVKSGKPVDVDKLTDPAVPLESLVDK